MAAPSESSRLLVQRIRLPENAHVYYTQFTCSSEDPYPGLDAVRRSLVSPEPLQPILDCLFPRIHISKDGPQLMVFCLGSQVSLTAPNKLKALAPAGLEKGISRVFDVSALYQKQPCGHSHSPCLICSSATFEPLPRKDSRTMYRIFLDAVRDHILHRLSASQGDKQEGCPVRLGRGFVLLPRRIEDSWATPWEQYVRSNGLLHLEIHIHLTAMDLIVQLNPQRLPSSPPLFACPVGTSLLLMPHSTPAYYLGTYSGSTAPSFMEFEENIVGWGIPRCLITETFIVCWVPLRRLQERQDGGAIVLWPKKLSLVNPSSPKLSFTPSIPFPTKPESLPSIPHQPNTPQPEYTLSAGNSETLDLPSMATAMGEYIDSIIKERQRRPDLPNTSRNPIEVSPTHSNFPSSALIGAQGDFATPAITYPSPPDQNLADLLRAIPVNTMMQTPTMEPSASLPEPQLPPEPDPEPEPQDHPMGSWDPFYTGVENINDRIDSTMFDTINATGVDGLNGFSKVWNDDDFNFFDAPATISDTIIVDAPAASGRDIDFGISTIDWTNGMLTAGAPITTPTFQAHGTATGGVTFQLPGVGQLSPTPNTNADFSSPHRHATATPSPGKTPFSVMHEIEIPSVMQVDAPPDSDMFSKIEFVDSITFDEADDKYLRGKFSLPSPPSDFQADARVRHLQNKPEEDKRKNGKIPWDSGLVRGGDIRMRYIDATNPRLGILHAISGGQVKSTHMPKEKPAGRKLQWKADDEPWRLATPPAEPESEISDESSGEEIGGSDTEAVSPGFQGHTAAPTVTTTTGSVPEGSKFLQARFDFSYIVKKGLAVVYDPATALTSAAPTMSVPTPVSPNAGAGGGDAHGSVSSQIAGRVATEAAENGLWAASIRAWGSNGKRQEGLAQFECRVLEKMVVEAMGVPLITLQEYVGVDVSTVTTPASAPTPKAKIRSRKGSIFSDTPPPVIEAAPEPKFYIGSGANVIQALPSILRFWNKLDVTPLSGTKDLCAIAVVPSDNPSSNSRSRTVGAWMQRLTSAYTARRFGSHSTTDMIQCGWGDIASSCLGAISRYGGFPTIVYLILPKAFVEYSTPIAQQVFTAVNELLTQSHITVHLVPDVLVYHSEALARHPVVGADQIVLNVYDRLGRRVEREHARLSTSYQSQLVVKGHAFTLARSRPLKVLYQDQWPPPSQMLFDRHTFLHVAYGWSKDREWIVASLVTERGDDHDRYVGSGGEDLSPGDLVDLVWSSFVERFAKKVDVEWRIVICRLGLIPEEELEAWGHLLAIKMEEAHLSPIHVSLVSFTLGDAPTFATAPLLPALPVPPVPLTRGSASKDSAVFVDSTSSTYYIYPQLLGIFPTLSDNLIKTEWITATSTEEDASWGLPVIPIATAWLLRVTRLPDWSVAKGDQVSPRYTVRSCQIHMHQLWKSPGCTYMEEKDVLLRDITRNFHELQVLERERRGSDVWLPHHLAGVDCMIQALDSISPSRSS